MIDFFHLHILRSKRNGEVAALVSFVNSNKHNRHLKFDHASDYEFRPFKQPTGNWGKKTFWKINSPLIFNPEDSTSSGASCTTTIRYKYLLEQYSRSAASSMLKRHKRRWIISSRKGRLSTYCSISDVLTEFIKCFN